jgi:replicative DNA helicase
MTGYIEKWRATADDVLSVMLVQKDAWEDVIELGVSESDFPSGAWRQVYRVIIDLRATRIKDPALPPVLLDTEVASLCDKAVAVEWVSERIALWDSLREMGFTRSCQLLIQYGRGHWQYETLRMATDRTIENLNNGLDPAEVAETAIDDLRSNHAVIQGVSVDIADLSEEAHALMEKPNETVVYTGIWLLDEWLRGLTPGEFVAWLAAYKMRKTSILSNVIVNLARKKKRVLFCSYDESRMRVTNRIRALLMAEYMWHHKHWDLRAEDGTALNVVDGKMIRNAGERWRAWPTPLQEAYTFARDTMKDMRNYLMVYDQFSGLGGLKSIRSIATIEAMRRGDLTMCAVDHIQRIPGFERSSNATYSAVEYGSSGLHEIGNSMGVIMWVLSQINEDAIKSSQKEVYSPNAKGGGGIASNADTVLTSKYKDGPVADPRYIHFFLKLAREGEAPLDGYVEIHPASGWITPRKVETKNITQAMQEASLKDV